MPTTNRTRTAHKPTASKSTARKSTARKSTARKPSTRRSSTARRSSSTSPAGTSRANGSRRHATAGKDAISLLRGQHREVETLFKEFEKSSEGAQKKRRKLVDRMITALSQHASIEEQYFYPVVRREVDDADSDVLEALEEHHVVKWELQELVDLDPDDERFEAKVTVLIENVRHHVREEEHEMFPEVRRALGRKRLLEVGAALESAGRVAPTRPHPRTPSTPPANLVMDPMAGAVDKARDLVRSARPGR